MSNDPRMQNGRSGQGGSGDGQMTGDPRMQNGAGQASGGGEPQKPDYLSQAQWDKLDPAAKKRMSGLRGSGGGRRQSGNSAGSSEGSGEGAMQNDARSGNSAGSASAPGAGSASAPGGGGAGPGRPFNGGQQPAQTEPITLKDKAIQAFQNGDDDGGFQYMYGHMIAEDAGRKQIALQMLPSVKRPRTAMRWGVGVVFKKNKDFDGAPPKIGEKPNVLPQPRNSNRNGRGRNSGGFGGGGAPGLGGGGSSFGGGSRSGNPGNGGIEELQYYTGEVGDILLEMLDKLRTRGQFGQMIAQVSKDNGTSSNSRNPSRGSYSAGASGSSGMIDDGRSEADLNRNRFGGGSNRNSGGRSNARNKSDDNATGSNYKNLLPGVLMLGKATLKSLQGRAKAHGIDVLVVFEVSCKSVPSTGQKINDTKISLYDVAKPAPVRVGRPSTTLNNIRIWMTRQNSQDDSKDPVRTAVRGIFEPGKEGGFLETYKIASMPNLNANQVMNRLTTLIPEGKASGNPMPALVELTYYRQKGLLPEKPYVDSVNQLTGSKIGDAMLNGEEEDRIKAISLLLPPEWKVQESAGSDAGDDLL
ncbi:MAG: hypothetical protein VX438_04010 [Planctomycetota bacterium]|nr:hypothetical protein [Planctomycetota bacterium]